MRIVTLVLAVLLVVGSGCIPYSMHNGTDMNQLNSFTIEKNKTTEADLISHLGKPEQTIQQSDGSHLSTWSGSQDHGYMNMLGDGVFIPNAVHNMTSRSITATIRNGVVVDYTVMDNNAHVGT